MSTVNEAMALGIAEARKDTGRIVLLSARGIGPVAGPGRTGRQPLSRYDRLSVLRNLTVVQLTGTESRDLIIHACGGQPGPRMIIVDGVQALPPEFIHRLDVDSGAHVCIVDCDDPASFWPTLPKPVVGDAASVHFKNGLSFHVGNSDKQCGTVTLSVVQAGVRYVETLELADARQLAADLTVAVEALETARDTAPRKA